MFTEKLLHHGGMVMDNKSIDIGGDIMNILKDLVNRVNEKEMIKTVLGEETYTNYLPSPVHCPIALT